MRQYLIRPTVLSPALLITSVAIVTLGVVAGCSQVPSHDVAYYKAHKVERSAMFRECTNNPGDGTRKAECTNALDAENQATLDPGNSHVGRIVN